MKVTDTRPSQAQGTRNQQQQAVLLQEQKETLMLKADQFNNFSKLENITNYESGTLTFTDLHKHFPTHVRYRIDHVVLNYQREKKSGLFKESDRGNIEVTKHKAIRIPATKLHIGSYIKKIHSDEQIRRTTGIKQATLEDAIQEVTNILPTIYVDTKSNIAYDPNTNKAAFALSIKQQPKTQSAIDHTYVFGEITP